MLPRPAISGRPACAAWSDIAGAPARVGHVPMRHDDVAWMLLPINEECDEDDLAPADDGHGSNDWRGIA